MGPFLQYATEKPADPIELRVYPGADGEFNLYEDENDNDNYAKGSFAMIPIRWNEKTQTLTIGDRRGKFPGMLRHRTFRVIWVGHNHGVGLASENRVDATVSYNGKRIEMKK